MKRGFAAICLLLISCVVPFSSSESLVNQKSAEIILPTITVSATKRESFPAIQRPCRYDYSTESAGAELLGKLDCLIEKAS